MLHNSLDDIIESSNVYSQEELSHLIPSKNGDATKIKQSSKKVDKQIKQLRTKYLQFAGNVKEWNNTLNKGVTKIWRDMSQIARKQSEQCTEQPLFVLQNHYYSDSDDTQQVSKSFTAKGMDFSNKLKSSFRGKSR